MAGIHNHPPSSLMPLNTNGKWSPLMGFILCINGSGSVGPEGAVQAFLKLLHRFPDKFRCGL